MNHVGGTVLQLPEISSSTIVFGAHHPDKGWDLSTKSTIITTFGLTRGWHIDPESYYEFPGKLVNNMKLVSHPKRILTGKV